ncbi:hypothetical protein D3C81_1430430 [compost metagenome]
MVLAGAGQQACIGAVSCIGRLPEGIGQAMAIAGKCRRAQYLVGLAGAKFGRRADTVIAARAKVDETIRQAAGAV